MFRQKNQKIPNVYDIANKHINQRNIYKIILKDLSTKESNKKDEISISLTLVEYEAVTVKVKSTTSTTITSTTNSSTTTNKTATTSSAYASYLENRGSSPSKTTTQTTLQSTLITMSQKLGTSSKVRSSPMLDTLERSNKK